jgi:glycosyl transferase, family 25
MMIFTCRSTGARGSWSGNRLLPILVINLARSRERWARVTDSARDAGFDVQRVPAVEGTDVPVELRLEIDAAKFRHNHGREMLDGEYGCYRSHLRALQVVVDKGYDLAIIAEDDIGLSADLKERVLAIFTDLPTIDLLKLVNHRTTGFVKYGCSALGDEFGRCLHGPQGSAACYAVTQRGARKLLRSLKTMWLPYDIAFERGWDTGANTFTTRSPLVSLERNHAETTIATSQQYRDAKLPKIKRGGALVFRIMDYVSRVHYGIKKYEII